MKHDYSGMSEEDLGKEFWVSYLTYQQKYRIVGFETYQNQNPSVQLKTLAFSGLYGEETYGLNHAVGLVTTMPCETVYNYI